jgi:hypothetical protein
LWFYRKGNRRNFVFQCDGWLQDTFCQRLSQRSRYNGKSKRWCIYIPFPGTRKFLVSPQYRIYVAAKNENKNKNKDEEDDQDNNNNNGELISSLRQAVCAPKHTPFLGISDCITYVRYISDLIDIEPTRFKETESIVSFPVDHIRDEKKRRRVDRKVIIHCKVILNILLE